MELVGFDTCRIILLAQVRRPDGQVYLPDAIAKVVERYSFVKAPAPDQALPFTFSVGKFQNSQIAELSIYNDGLIVSSASDTDFLDAFLSDLLPWAVKEFGFVERAKQEKFYESTIIVKSDVDLSASLRPQSDLSYIFAGALNSAGIQTVLKFSGFEFDFDLAELERGKRKPYRFIVDRRIGIPFSDNIFFSQSPFRTKDHLEVLTQLERMQGEVH